MPTMVTFQAGRAILVALLACLAGACSREPQDWRSAQAANSPEGWQRFLEQHPESELRAQARARITELQTQRDFQYADRIGTIEAYRDFLGHHPSGEWSERARIRIESFSLGSAPRMAPPPTPEQAAAFGRYGVRALRLATAEVPAPGAGASGGDGAAPAGGIQTPVSRVGGDGAGAGPIPPATPEGAVEPAAVEPASTGRAVPGEAAQSPAEAVIKPAALNDSAPPPGYGVQLGAFGSEASADREWRRLRGRFGAELGSLSPRIVIAETDSGELYRLQAPAAGEAQARAICDSLHEQSQACIPVLPR
jgi:cell division septation protein DedD